MTKDRYVPFGERTGVVQTVDLPLNDIPVSFRRGLWNFVQRRFARKNSSGQPPDVWADQFWLRMAADKRWDMDEHRQSSFEVCALVIKEWLLDPKASAWHEIYDFIENFARWARFDDHAKSVWEGWANDFLLDERSPYRFVSHRLTPITSSEEQLEVAEAAGRVGKYGGASAHLRKALAHFSARPSPDYENACKEAASAVEAALNTANSKQSAVGNAVKTFSKAHQVHNALTESASKLFGYASDRDGVRHAAKSQCSTPVDYAEAKLVIVSASAWLNFIVLRAP
jgi:hypothetical protein